MKKEPKERRSETLAMRISQAEHERLKAAAATLALREAELVRQAVDHFLRSAGKPAVFRP